MQVCGDSEVCSLIETKESDVCSSLMSLDVSQEGFSLCSLQEAKG